MKSFKCENIEEIKFKIKLNQIKRFQSFRSKVFFVRGNSWTVEIRKEKDELRLSLRSECNDIPENRVIIAHLTAKLHSFRFEKDAHQMYMSPCPFHSNFRNWKALQSISWNRLTDLENGFIKNDSCQIEIQVKATPMLNLINDKWILFKQDKLCSESTFKSKYFITIKKIDEFFGICTPTFIVNDLTWQIELFRNENPLIDPSLHIRLYNMADRDELRAKHKVKVSLKLISYDLNAEDVKYETTSEYDRTIRSNLWTIISWNDLINPKNKFLNNDEFTVEFTIEVEETETLEAPAKKFKFTNGQHDRSMEVICGICLDNLFDHSVSSLSCGHMFCTQCIEKALQQKYRCPTCNQWAIPIHLRSMYFS